MSDVRRFSIAGVGLSVAVLALTACGGDGQQGLPTETQSAPTTEDTTTTTQPTTTVAPPPGPAVGEVAGNPEAASALRAFLVDLEAGGVPAVAPTCWTIPPSEVPQQYADVPAILDAAAAPGVDGPATVTWSGPAVTLSVARTDAASGYACPRVAPAGAGPVFSDADATYTVARYLGRFTGSPVSPGDLEGDFPLVCADVPTWDPQGTGAPTVPPLVNNPGRLTGSASYNPDSVYVAAVNGIYTTVYADVTDVSGFEQNRVFTLASGPNGYCIGDVA
ncbi:hypothetical protein HQ346_05055 [Rhodococcus sp. BP-252]|uniref:LppP/LprE lipoprotein n=1 Tax=Rhodococcoides kyotonense TaxID=398843 RepID=A0A177Y9C8_9NOCA|nr:MULTISPECIES: hypothetical protein [Rhodococcus]MBY6410596.1 hypothetical protein [Rhodococcus sp. BP-320]MBY6415579.1 hypothetical protein [Rhodococcus sp. BP-321]MBY6424722.1 hypothetical protein [Rhodococcus sp. BP-324]MBY6425152.1 hypothetical protein [Rhodococcus sp. BP-323]MBY6430785.1 hypothetical protein [Rhodococcus sp. BP-322]